MKVSAIFFLFFVVFSKNFIDCCKTVTPIKNLNVTAIRGSWYEIKRYEGFVLDKGECGTALIYERDRVSSNVKISQKDLKTNSFFKGEGYIYPEEIPTGPPPHAINGRLLMVIPKLSPTPVSYTILDTDYNGYIVIWSCQKVDGIDKDLVWIMGREKTISKQIESKIEKTFATNDIDVTQFHKIKHDNDLCTP